MVERYNPLEDEDEGESLLAYHRKRRGVTQEEMAAAVGISVRTYRRLELGQVDDPGIRVLHNCAIALGTSLNDITPPQWRHWTTFRESASTPPKWEAFFHPEREGADPDLSVKTPDNFLEFGGRWERDRRSGLERLAAKLARES